MNNVSRFIYRIYFYINKSRAGLGPLFNFRRFINNFPLFIYKIAAFIDESQAGLGSLFNFRRFINDFPRFINKIAAFINKLYLRCFLFMERGTAKVRQARRRLKVLNE